MKQIKLKKLTFTNFKGFKNKTIEFNGNTSIFGRNATGKTTVLDGWLYLMFGKDSTDRKDFEIKTLDSGNKAEEKIDHEVYGEIEIDGSSVSMKRSLREKWQTKRGSETAEFVGNETEYEYDGIPKKAGEFKSIIDKIIDESVFKILTDVSYFNTDKKFSWQERRALLTKIAGDISDDSILGSITDSTSGEKYKFLSALLNKNTDLQQYKLGIQSKKKTIKDEIKLIPARIDEVKRGMPDEPDYDEINKWIGAIGKEIENIESQIADKAKISEKQLQESQARQKRLYEIKSRVSAIEHEENEKSSKQFREKQSEINVINSDIRSKSDYIAQLGAENNRLQQSVSEKEQAMAKLRDNWELRNKEKLEFGDNDFTCPTCKREFEADDIATRKEEMSGNFNRKKISDLDGIQNEGKRLANEVSNIKKTISDNNAKVSELTGQIEALKLKLPKEQLQEQKTVVDLSANEEYKKLKAEISSIENLPTPGIPDISDLKSKKSELSIDLDKYKAQLAIKSEIEKSKARMDELNRDMKAKAQEVANLEKQEFIVDDFVKAKVGTVESRVNAMFKYVKFKMFNTLINGGVEETCVALIDGVPYPDANNAAKINAGIEVSNVLSGHFGVSCPLWVDNAESVNELIQPIGQLIQLIVTNEDEELKITYNQ